MTHYVASITVEDSIDQLAPVAVLEIVPVLPEEVVLPHAVLQSLELYSLDDLPKPDSLYPDLAISVNGASITSLLHAHNLYVVDVTERLYTDKVGYTLTLVGDDPNAGHNRRFTQVYPSPTAVDGIGSVVLNKITNESIGGAAPEAGTLARTLDMFRLRKLETETHLTIGDCDYPNPVASTLGLGTAYLDALPEYRMYGTAEFRQVSFLDALRSYIAPFNTFPHTKFFLRLREGVVHAQRVSYSGTLRGRYTPSIILSQQKSTERYSPILFGRDVLCTGGEKWEPSTPTESRTLSGTMTETQRYTSEVQQQVFSGEETWVEGETTYEIQIEIRKDTIGTLILLPTLEGNILQLSQGFIDDLRILDTKVVKKIERQYSKLNGLLSERVFNYTYESRVFNNGIYVRNGVEAIDCGSTTSFPPQIVLVEDTVTETLFWNGKALPNKHTRTTYSWNSVGSQVATTTQVFIYMGDGWVQDTVQVQMADPVQLTTALIRFWSSYNQNLKSLRDKASSRAKRPLDKWMLLNGSEVDATKYSIDCQEAEVRDFNNVFELTVPCAGKVGLQHVWRLARVQQSLEASRAYWVAYAFTTVLDVNANIGMPYGTDDASGIVVRLTHTITPDSATTRVETRKLTV